MPTILLSLELRDQASTATRQVSQQMALMEAATTKASTGMDALEAASKRAAATLDLVAGSARSAAGALDTLATSMAAASREFGALDTAARAAGAAMDAQIAHFAGVRDASAAATIAIRQQISALGDLALVARLQGFASAGAATPAPSPAASAANTVAGTAARDAGQLALLRRFGTAGGVLGTGLATDVGLGGRVLNAALGPEGLIAGGFLYGGYKAAQASNQFYSAVAGLAAATGTTPSANAPITQASLRTAGSGTSQFSATQLLTQGQPFLAAGLSADKTAQVLPYLAQGAALLSGLPGGTDKQANYAALAQAVTDLMNTFGQGQQTSARLIKSFIDMTVAADQFSKAAPGALAGNIAKVIPAAQAAGVGLPETFAAIAAETHTGESTRFAATNLARLLTNVSLRTPPTPAQERAALGLGVEIGPNAIKDYGSLTGFLQAVLAGAKRDPNAQSDLYALTGTSNAFRGLTEILKQLQTGTYTQFVRTAATSEGTVGRQYPGYLANSPNAQLTGIANQFNTDLINAGKTLTDTFQPDLISAAKAILGAAEGAGNALGAFGHQLDTWSAQLNIPKNVPNAIKNALSLTPETTPYSAVIGAAASALPVQQAPQAGQGPGHWEIRAGGGRGGAIRVWVPDAAPAASFGPVPGASLFGGIGPTIPATPSPTEGASREFFNPSAFTPNVAPPVPTTEVIPGAVGAPPIRNWFIARAQDTQTANARLAATDQASSAYARLTGDAKTVKQAQDDLANKIAAGLPTDNVVRQLGVYSAALKQLKTDFDTFQASSAAAYGKAVPVPGISDTGIANQQQRATRAVGQYGYAAAKSQFDIGRQQFLSGQESAAQFQQQYQAALTAVGQDSGVSGAQRQALGYGVARQYETATGSVNRANRIGADQLAVTRTQQDYQYAQQANTSPAQLKKAFDAYIAAQRKALEDTYTSPSQQPQLQIGLRNLGNQQRLFAQQQTATADQLAVTAAQQNLDAARMMNATPDQLKVIFDQYIAAQRQLAQDTQKGPQLQATLRGLDKSQAANDYVTRGQDIARGQRDIQNRIAIDQATGNLGDLAKAFQALESFSKANAGPLHLDASDLARQKAEDQRALRGIVTPTPPPFRQNQPGLGALAAGPGGTVVRFGGGQDPQLEEIRRLRQQLQQADRRAEQAEQRAERYLAQIQRNTADQARRRGAAPPS